MPAGPRSGPQAASAPGIQGPPRPLPGLPTAESQARWQDRRRRDAGAAPPATGRGPQLGAGRRLPPRSRSAAAEPTRRRPGPSTAKGRSPGSGVDFRKRQPKGSSGPTHVLRLPRSSCQQSAGEVQARGPRPETVGSPPASAGSRSLLCPDRLCSSLTVLV